MNKNPNSYYLQGSFAYLSLKKYDWKGEDVREKGKKMKNENEKKI